MVTAMIHLPAAQGYSAHVRKHAQKRRASFERCLLDHLDADEVGRPRDFSDWTEPQRSADIVCKTGWCIAQHRR